MDESVQQHLAAPTAAPTVCKTPNPDLQLNAPARKPTFVKARREYIDFFAKYTRSPYNAAKLYSYLVFHAQRNKKGLNAARLEVMREGGPWEEPAYWWVQTRKDIASACAMTEDQFRTAMQVLEKAEVATHRRGRYTGRLKNCTGKTVSHIRLGVCNRGNGLDAWPSVEQMVQMRIIPGGDKPPLIIGAKSPGLLQDALVVGDAVTGKEESFKPGNEKTVADNAQDDAQLPPGKKRQKQTCSDEVIEEETAKFGKPKKAKKQVCPDSIDASFDACVEVAKRYGEDYALAICKKAGFIPLHWKMLPKDACEAVLGIADDLAVEHPSYSWEEILTAFSPTPYHGPQRKHGLGMGYYSAGTGWDRLLDLSGDNPNTKPYLSALRKRMPVILEWLGPDAALLPDPDALPMADAPESTATTPPASPAICIGIGAEPQAAVAPTIVYTVGTAEWLEEQQFISQLRAEKEAQTMSIIAANGWSKSKPVAVPA
ncbi:hypothetical protein PQQ75_04165 [Paraburkholderia aspalathi]|uniref:hypothetical protein n=1 Tax=Paraburkholderia aspalathi TaxID=1324617 RepID=UPI0038B70851